MKFIDGGGLFFPEEAPYNQKEFTHEEAWERHINAVWDQAVGEEEENFTILNFEADLNSLSVVVNKANTHNLTDFDVVALRSGYAAFSDAIQEIRDLHEYIDELNRELKKARSDATSWYAGWTSGWNAQREGKSMAECPIALERFKAQLDQDPYMDYIAEEVAGEFDMLTDEDIASFTKTLEEAACRFNPWGGRVSSEMAMEDEQQNAGLRVSPDEDSLDLFDPDTGAVLPIGPDFVSYGSNGIYPRNRPWQYKLREAAEDNEIRVSPTEYFKDKNRIAQQEKLINKLEGEIQQLREETKHD